MLQATRLKDRPRHRGIKLSQKEVVNPEARCKEILAQCKQAYQVLVDEKERADAAWMNIDGVYELYSKPARDWRTETGGRWGSWYKFTKSSEFKTLHRRYEARLGVSRNARCRVECQTQEMHDVVQYVYMSKT